MSLSNTFQNTKRTAATAGLATLLAFSGVAHAENDNDVHDANFSYGPETGLCADYEKNDDSQELGAFGSANQFSEAEENDIAIIVYTGGLDAPPESALNGGEKFASIFEEQGLKAQCFAGGHDETKGTRFLFLVNGQLVPETRGLAITQAIEEIDNVASEARIVRQSGAKGNADYLVSAVNVYLPD